MIGKMKLITLEQWKTVKDANGNNVESRIKNFSCWAEVTYSSGQRSSLNGQGGFTNYTIFKIHYHNFDPTSNWRIIYDRRKYSPAAPIVKENEREFFWIIKAQANAKR